MIKLHSKIPQPIDEADSDFSLQTDEEEVAPTRFRL